MKEMKNWNLYAIMTFTALSAGLALAGAVLSCASCKGLAPKNSPAAAVRQALTDEADVPVDFNRQLFYDAVKNHPVSPGVDGAHFSGGIISHHDLASDIIAGFFAKLSEDKDINTIVVIGPNHKNIGLSPVISGRVRWETPLGQVDNDYGVLDELKGDNLISFDEKNIRDHSIKTLLPFIKHYFPDAKIVPLIFTSEETENKDIQLAQKIKDLSGGRVFVLASLDFSHYLSLDEADKRDEMTLDAMRKRDYGKIETFTSDNTDSHWALITLLRVMELEGADKEQILAHTNSARFPGQDPNYTTSYFSILYGR